MGMTEMRECKVHIPDGAVDHVPRFVAQARNQDHEITQWPAMLVMRRCPLAQRLCAGIELDGDAGQVHGSGAFITSSDK